VRICDDVVFHDLQGELVLLNLKTGVYFGLDSVGTRIWHLIQEHGSLQKVRDSLVEEYEVTETRCEQDLLTLASRLRENGLLEVCQ
jgi:hypothetical protein